MDDAACEELYEGLRGCSDLKILKLNNNKGITRTGLESIAKLLSSNPWIQELNIQFNRTVEHKWTRDYARVFEDVLKTNNIRTLKKLVRTKNKGTENVDGEIDRLLQRNVKLTANATKRTQQIDQRLKEIKVEKEKRIGNQEAEAETWPAKVWNAIEKEIKRENNAIGGIKADQAFQYRPNNTGSARYKVDYSKWDNLVDSSDVKDSSDRKDDGNRYVDRPLGSAGQAYASSRRLRRRLKKMLKL